MDFDQVDRLGKFEETMKNLFGLFIMWIGASMLKWSLKFLDEQQRREIGDKIIKGLKPFFE